MDAKFVRERITQLRLQKDVSEYKMSYDLGHCRSYINNIASGKGLPSMTEFFAICEYFEITPLDFFDPSLKSPKKQHLLLDAVSQLDEEDMDLVLQLINRLQKKK